MFQTSVGINVSERDLTAGARAVSVSDAAFAGPFQWGPAHEPYNITSEDELVRVFGKPDEDIFTHWFTAAGFLSYSGSLRVVRALPNTALNATAAAKTLGTASSTSNSTVNTATWVANTFTTSALVVGQTLTVNGTSYTVNSVVNSTAFTTNSVVGIINNLSVSASGLSIKNRTQYEETYATGATGLGAWAGKYPGQLGNTLRVSVVASGAAFTATPSGSITLASGSNVVTGTSTSFTTDVTAGDILTVSGINYTVASVTNTTSMTLTTLVSSATTAGSGSWTRKWAYTSQFNSAPGTSGFASARGALNDEMHIAIIDEDGAITGVPGTILERYAYVSKASDAKTSNGESNYYVNVINRTSAYIWWLGHPGANTSGWGSLAAGVTFGAPTLIESVSLVGGQANNATVADADIQTAMDLFSNKDEIDISLVVTGPASASLASYAIQNICETRADCVAFVSPPKNAVVNNSGNEVAAITTHRNSLPSSSYGFLDSGWKYTYDKYNDKMRWVPLNGDTAGIAARADVSSDPWFSPAGFTRGNVKNIVKLAWNPKQLDRDDLYKMGVNPVVSFPAQGVVLYGDKTLLDRPSAFDRINVRRLFIVLEKTIARLARTQLFEFNDEFTRSQFRNIVEPFLRDVKSRRGVIDYRVICDDSNNTSEVIEQNRFVGDIFVKPARSINFIQLNFVAVRDGVSFQEVIG